ncbi:3-methyl-2-oxobutanoate hydroxymethyltransferase [Sporomusa sphaeroides]|uniref:3-methyl-2-oxobutanoate hydroxymethyltransferase n=1 Tax=Sporomusa sphaeroides DSM 2875 TaxID=1337886 RepID=A0ABM9W6N5_9FIRM|nr:3-methyl-2-oxobutanoate hydroxymethyltransferase [Sporomusa sphaeroides]OLS54577.1 3-methyl-2-oxobutanoate hydroxymethyltransferase [Sporomusa sphaeroides DSM 2875]CVK20809.1 3-methyl-2-oxobutanoate hydroxymethyltransferase [Sporomusa sphaeroides DSM 2875]
MSRTKVTIPYLMEKKAKKEQITMITGYDYPMALLEEKAGIDIILCGDSLGMTVYGFDGTLPVTMDMMIVHSAAVKRGAPNAFVIGDMPFLSYQVSPQEAVRNAGRFMKEANVDCIKLEGGAAMAETVKAIVNAGIPVMGHLGLTPQSTSALGGFKAQGRSAEAACRIIEDAAALEAAGVCSILLEAIPPEVARIITESSKVPIISIGAGIHCDGQLLIVHDMLGFFDRFVPKFVKKYANMNGVILEALLQYKAEVEQGVFPGKEQCYGMPAEELGKLNDMLKR